MRVLWLSALVVVLDQLSKAVVVQFMHRHESIRLLGDWLKLTYTENPGMAFGITFGPPGLVTVFSMVATALVGWYLWSVRSGYTPYLASLAMVLGGAIGNIIDRTFYGVLMGYDGFFLGHVVDFIHVDLGYFIIPQVVPFLGGSYIALFPIWNVADMAIVGGVVGILIFQKTFHRQFLQEMHDREQHDEGQEHVPAATNGRASVPYVPPSMEEKHDDVQ